MHLTGHEIDAFRIYQDLYSRYDHALAHMRGLHGLEYLSDGFEKQPGCFDMITMFFPFVFPGDHLEWGLPDPLFCPLELLHNAWDSLKPGGLLLVVNQGEAEHEAEGEMFNQLDIHPRAGYRQDPLLFSYDLDRYVWTAVRDA